MPLPQQPDAVAGGARPPHNLRAEATELLVRLSGNPVATFLLLRRRGSGGALAVVAIIFSWMATSNHYIRQSTIYRAWEKQQATGK